MDIEKLFEMMEKDFKKYGCEKMICTFDKEKNGKRYKFSLSLKEAYISEDDDE